LIQLLQLALQMAVPPPSPPPERPPVRCDRCGQVMTILIRLAQPGNHRMSRVKSLGRLASNKLAGEGRRWLGGCRVRQRGTGDRKAGPTRL
jgi:hypothetical protein